MKIFIKIAATAMIWFVIIPIVWSSPNEQSYDCRFYNAYITGDMTEWPAWMNQIEDHYLQRENHKLLYDLVMAYYGYVGYLIGVDQHEKAEEYIEKGIYYVEQLDNYAIYQSLYEAMKGAFYAFRIGISSSLTVWLGPKSMSHINKAVELDSTNPVAWVEKANAEYHMPRIFGGSYGKAVEYYRKAVGYFEEQPDSIGCNWMYLNALAWLAKSYDKAEMVVRAEMTYQRILKIEPDFSWVKNELYPSFKKRHENIKK